MIVMDNNFSDGHHERRSDGSVEGISFLKNLFGRALNLLPEEERPLVVCFAPSSEVAIETNTDELWQKWGIVSLHKAYDRMLIPLEILIAERFGAPVRGETLIHDVMGFASGDDLQKVRMNENLRQYCEGLFPGESMYQVKGPGYAGASWEGTIGLFSEALQCDPLDLEARIESAIEMPGGHPEGNGRPEMG